MIDLEAFRRLPLEIKVKKSLNRIQEWYEHWGGDVYVSFSGGKQSSVLLHLVKQLYKDIPVVFLDSGLEYPEIREFVKSFSPPPVILRPAIRFDEVLRQYGYPVISKEQSHYIYELRHSNSEKLKEKRLNGVISDSGRVSGKISDKWQYLAAAPFEISDRCCDVMKKRPFKKYEKDTGRKMMTGETAEESMLRQQQYLAHGCNGFNMKRPKSTPLGFWTEQDTLRYIKENDVPYCKAFYGDIVYEDKYTTTKYNRSGCMFCAYGVHSEKGLNRFQLMQKTHPKQWKYCIYDLGLKEVLEYINVPYCRPPVARDKYKEDTVKISCRLNKEKFEYVKEVYGNLSNTELIDMLIDDTWEKLQ